MSLQKRLNQISHAPEPHVSTLATGGRCEVDAPAPDRATHQRPAPTAAPSTDASDATQATADLGSNAQLQEQLAKHAAQSVDAPMLDQVESQQGERLKLNGFGKIASDLYFGGEPTWATNDSWNWFEDGMEVMEKYERSAEDKQWESPSSSLGYVLTGPQVHSGG